MKRNGGKRRKMEDGSSSAAPHNPWSMLPPSQWKQGLNKSKKVALSFMQNDLCTELRVRIKCTYKSNTWLDDYVLSLRCALSPNFWSWKQFTQRILCAKRAPNFRFLSNNACHVTFQVDSDALSKLLHQPKKFSLFIDAWKLYKTQLKLMNSIKLISLS